MTRITVEVSTAEASASRSIVTLSRPKIAATMQAPMTPVAAHSDGVATPARIRPITEAMTRDGVIEASARSLPPARGAAPEPPARGRRRKRA